MVKEYAIDTTITYNGITLLVTQAPNNEPVCTGCYFSNYQMRKRGMREFSCCNHHLACTKGERKDRKHVIFKEI